MEHEIKSFDNFEPNAVGKRIKKLDKYTNLAAGLERAYYLLKSSARPDTNRAVLLFSDGRIDLPGGKKAEIASEQYLRNVLVPAMKKQKIGVFAFIPEELSADYPFLQELAENTGGGYFRGLPKDATDFRAQILTILTKETRTKPTKREAKVSIEPKKPKTAPADSIKTDNGSQKTTEMTKTVFMTVLLIIAGGLALIAATLFFVVYPIRRSRRQARELASILDDVRVLRKDMVHKETDISTVPDDEAG